MRNTVYGTLIFVASSILVSFSVQAAELTTDSIELVPPVTAVPRKPAIVSPYWNYRGTPFKDQISLGVGDEHYLNDAPVGDSDYIQVYGRLRYQTDPEQPFMGTIDLGASTSLNVNNYSNYEVVQAHVNWEELDPETWIRASVSVGRRKFAWSTLDSEWLLGVVQPFNRFDGLRPVEQGLTGAFASVGAGHFDLLGFVSGIYIPEQGAPYEINDSKQITTTSPWFDPPPEEMIFENSEERDVRYDVQIPPIKDIVFQPSQGILARASDPDGEGYYAQVGILRKPRNTIALPFIGKLCLEDATNYGCVTVKPEVTYATVKVADVGYVTKNYAFGVSGLEEDPDDLDRVAEYNYQLLDTMRMVSVFAELRTFQSSYWGPRLRVSYLNTVDGGNATLVGPLATNTNVFGARTMFRKALSISAKTLLYRSGRWSLDNSIKLIDEMDEDGTILMVDFGVNIGQHWSISMYADFLGSQKPLDQTDTFISRYRGNDRVAAIVNFLF
ncbi:MAG TPA: hypothetical protein VM432_04145 [Bdellovibrionales bacterium]|nr:hypothetical protein [Bdellovibrionales bacterium]